MLTLCRCPCTWPWTPSCRWGPCSRQLRTRPEPWGLGTRIVVIVGYLGIFRVETLLVLSGVSGHFQEVGRSFLSYPGKGWFEDQIIKIFLVTLPWYNIARGNTWCIELASSLTILSRGQCWALSSELVSFVKTNSPKLIIYSYLTCSCDYPRWRPPGMVWFVTRTNRLLIDNVGT